MKTGKKIAVIGGGNTAMDACRTSIRLGAEKVYAIYRRTKDDMPAIDIEITEALEEGVEPKFLLNPVEIINDGEGNVKGIKLEKMKKVGLDSRGRSKVEPTGVYETLNVDSVIMSIGQKLNIEGLESIGLNERGNIESKDKTFETNLDGVFAGGDCINDGADIAIHAVDDGRKSAIIIDSYLQGEIKPIRDEFYVEKKDLTIKDFPDVLRQEKVCMSHEAPEARKHNFVEIVHGFTEDEAVKEAGRCLECGCKEVYKCDLLKYSNEYNVEPERFNGDKNIYEIDDSHSYIIKDSNKCIHCGQCIRVCDQVMDIGALGLVNRGFETIVLPALDKSLDQTNCISCGQCINICPTGALQERMLVDKPIPVIPEITNTTCASCSIGCQVNIESKGNLLLRAIPDYMDKTSEGLLCQKGKFEFGDNGIKRFIKPLINKNGKLEEVSFEEAILYIARKAQSMNLLYGKNSLGVSISDKLTNEEIYLASKYAKDVLKTENIFNINGRKSGLQEVLGVDTSTNTLNEIINTDVVINIGANLMDDYLIAGIKVKKAHENGATIININKEITKVNDWASFSMIGNDISEILNDIYLSIVDNKEVSKKIEDISNVLKDSNKVMFIFDEENISTNDEVLIANIAKITKHIGSPRNGIIKLRKNINGQGLVDMGVSSDAKKYLDKIENKDIKGLLLLGNKLPENNKFELLDFLMIMTDHLTEEIMKADVILPISRLIESEGCVTSCDRRILSVNPAVKSQIGYSNLEIIKKLMNVYSTNIKFNSSKEIRQEICKNIHKYEGSCNKNKVLCWPTKSSCILFGENSEYKL
jgi:formate dehydrogenase major subunit